MSNPRIAFSLLIMLLLVVTAGCSDDDDNPAAPAVEDFAESTAELMLNFRAAYAEMDDESYVDLLDDRFAFYYTDGLVHDATLETMIIANMFSGNPPTNAVPGFNIHGFRAIEVRKFDLVEIWADVSESHPDFGSIAGAMKALYDVQIVFHHDDGTLTMSSQQIFYAVSFDVTEGGEVKTCWRLLGQEDIPFKAGNEDMSWSGIKTLFR